MKKYLFLIVIFFNFYSYSQNKQTIYFDKDWKECSKEKAAFFRPMPLLSSGNHELVRDYYINGNLQMQGYSLKNNDKKYIIDIYYYDDKNTESISTNNNLEDLNGTFSYFYYDGKLWKTITYKNGELFGRNTYFFKDGTQMLDGIYQNGNCISGSVAFDTKLNSEFRLKKGEPEKQITKVLYWENSKQIAQKQTILLKKYGRELIGQQNFDKSGKLIQKLTENAYPTRSYYDETISEGIDFEYYIRNDCAVNLKSETHYSLGQKNGSSINFDISGKVINKIIYKNDSPIEGLLEEKLNYNLFVISNYKNSLKEGEEVAKTNKDSIVAKGIYKLGKPFNGQFVTEKTFGNDSEYIINNVENYIESGLQQILDHNIKVIKSYYLINGLKEGIVTTIIDDLKSEVEYKNDLPYDGILKSKNSVTIYKKGFLVSSTTVYNENPNQILIKKEYENGKIVKVISSQFNISVDLEKNQNEYLEFDKNNSAENQFQGYVGFYKDEKPFSGFFESESGEFKIVDFFENGIIKFQYSKDWFTTLAESENKNTDLNLKATFVDGKIVDGNEYFDYNKIKVTKNWKNSVIKTLDIDFFEIHYYNRLHHEIKNNVLEISELINKDFKMNIDFKNNELIENFVIKDEILTTPKSVTLKLNDAFIPSSIVLYFESENEILVRSESTEIQNNSVLNEYSSSLIVKGYFTFSNTYKSKNVSDLLSEIASKFVNDENALEKIFKNLENKTDNDKIIADLLIDKKGKPESGIWITKNLDNTYLLKLFSEGKLIKTKDKVGFKDCKSEAKKLQ